MKLKKRKVKKKVKAKGKETKKIEENKEKKEEKKEKIEVTERKVLEASKQEQKFVFETFATEPIAIETTTKSIEEIITSRPETTMPETRLKEKKQEKKYDFVSNYESIKETKEEETKYESSHKSSSETKSFELFFPRFEEEFRELLPIPFPKTIKAENLIIKDTSIEQVQEQAEQKIYDTVKSEREEKVKRKKLEKEYMREYKF